MSDIEWGQSDMITRIRFKIGQWLCANRDIEWSLALDPDEYWDSVGVWRGGIFGSRLVALTKMEWGGHGYIHYTFVRCE